jgi:hypothetical protein
MNGIISAGKNVDTAMNGIISAGKNVDTLPWMALYQLPALTQGKFDI